MSRRVMALPIPDPAPVTMAVLNSEGLKLGYLTGGTSKPLYRTSIDRW